MKHHFKKKLLSTFIVFFLLLINLNGVSLYLNSNLLTTDDNINDTLLNLYPPLFEAWKIEVTSNNKIITINDDKINQNFESYKLSGNTLRINNKDYYEVSKINIEAERLQDKSLEVWISWEGIDQLKDIICKWGMKYNIDINIISTTNSTSRLESVVQSKTTPPDLVLVPETSIDELVKASAIQPIPSYILNNIKTELKERFLINNIYYASPFYYDVQLLFYNPDLVNLNKYANLSLADIETESKNLIGKIEIPLTWNSYSTYWLLPFIYSYNTNNQINFDYNLSFKNEPTLNALIYLQKLNKQPYFEPLEKNAMLSYFIEGKTAIILSSSYTIPYFEKLGIKYEVKSFPFNNESQEYLKPLTDTKAFVIPKGSHHTLLSYRLLQYLISEDVQMEFCSSQFKMSPNYFVETTLMDTNPYYKTILSNKSNFSTIPNNSNYTTYKNLLWKLLRFIYTDQLSPQQVIEKGEQLLINNK